MHDHVIEEMTHPALFMLRVWAVCILLYVVLPFHLIDRNLTIQGFVTLFLFLAAFCVGALVVRRSKGPYGPLPLKRIDFSIAKILLSTAGVVTIIAMLLDLRDKSVFDLTVAYALRSEQSGALLEGEASSSTLGFQIGFLTYPAAYIYLVYTIIFEAKPKLLRLMAFGFTPVLLVSVAMAGRSPVLYAIVISFFAFGVRKMFLHRQDPIAYARRKRRTWRGMTRIAGIAAIMLGAMYYFVAVFFVRAELQGGASNMFDVAEESWGIGFAGFMTAYMFQMLGEELTYIIFIFNWYFVQGLVMANFLFSDYHGPMQLGVYGVDLVSAVVRRINGNLVAQYFDSLSELKVYGFFPSAFGSLYVDLRYFGLGICAGWGMLAGLVYQRIKSTSDSRWLIFAPFVAAGILFSPINTPIGFANGLVTHFWMLVAFMSSAASLPRRQVAVLAENHA